MAKDNRINLRIRLEPQLKNRLDDVVERRKTSQQHVLDALVGWFVEQDGKFQLLLLEQVDDGDVGDIARMTLRQMEAGAAVPRFGKVAGQRGQDQIKRGREKASAT